MHDALPSNHDDDDGGADGQPPNRARPRFGRRDAPPAGSGRGRRPGRVAAPDALHHPGDLRLLRAVAAVVRPAPCRARARTHTRTGTRALSRRLSAGGDDLKSTGGSSQGGSTLNPKRAHTRTISIAIAFCLSTAAFAETRPKRTEVGSTPPAAILWVGNSFFYYNNSMHSHVGNLVRAHDPKSAYRAPWVTISGSEIDWHDMESYSSPNEIEKYSFVDNEIVLNKPGRQFDAVRWEEET